MNLIKNNFKQALLYLKTFVKWLIIASFVGFLGGAIGSVFHISIDYATLMREENPWILYFLPAGGIVIAGIYHIFKSRGSLDTNRVLDAAAKEEKVPLVMAPLIFISTCLTHLLGGSAGREGAALQLGGSIGYNTGKALRLKNGDMHIVTMAGMSAVFAALFGTPASAAFFSFEVTRVGLMHYSSFVPSVMAALVASQIAKLFGLHAVKFDGVVFGNISIESVILVIAVSLLCAIVGILFCSCIHKTEKLFEKIFPSRYIRAFVGGILIVVLTYIVGTRDYNGAGMNVITDAIGGKANYEAFILKIIFTSVTIAAGFKGGEIVPAFFVGSTFGCIMGQFLGLDPSFAAAIGFVAVFCSVTNCPTASLMLAIEVFGGGDILIFALVCGVSYMMSGYSGLYKSQSIAFSKLGDELLDKTSEF